MKLQEIKAIARSKGVKNINLLKKADIIRVIQKTEGNSDCFGSIKSNGCGQMNCLWREDCLKTS